MVYLNGQINSIAKYKDLINPLGKSVKNRVQLEPIYQIIKNAEFTLEPLEMFVKLYPQYEIRFTSFFRSEPENKRVGGSDTSDHKRGLAVDFEVINKDTKVENNKAFVDFVVNRQVPFDQIILFNSKNNPTAIHFGRGERMRGMFLRYTRANGYQRINY